MAQVTTPEIRARGLTWHEVDALYPELERRELHDGVLLMAPMPAWWHQRVALQLATALNAWAQPRGGEALLPVDVVTAEDRMYHPDVILLLPGHLDRLDEDGKLHAPPDLAVEVSSPSTRAFDLTDKRDAYAEFAVPEYWFVDLEARAVAVHRLEDRAYPDPAVVSESGALTSPQAPGLRLPVADLLRGVPPPDRVRR